MDRRLLAGIVLAAIILGLALPDFRSDTPTVWVVPRWLAGDEISITSGLQQNDEYRAILSGPKDRLDERNRVFKAYSWVRSDGHPTPFTTFVDLERGATISVGGLESEGPSRPNERLWHVGPNAAFGNGIELQGLRLNVGERYALPLEWSGAVNLRIWIESIGQGHAEIHMQRLSNFTLPHHLPGDVSLYRFRYSENNPYPDSIHIYRQAKDGTLVLGNQVMITPVKLSPGSRDQERSISTDAPAIDLRRTAWSTTLETDSTVDPAHPVGEFLQVASRDKDLQKFLAESSTARLVDLHYVRMQETKGHDVAIIWNATWGDSLGSFYSHVRAKIIRGESALVPFLEPEDRVLDHFLDWRSGPFTQDVPVTFVQDSMAMITPDAAIEWYGTRVTEEPVAVRWTWMNMQPAPSEIMGTKPRAVAMTPGWGFATGTLMYSESADGEFSKGHQSVDQSWFIATTGEWLRIRY